MISLTDNTPPLASETLRPLLTPISQLKQFPINYNKHPPAQIQRLIQSIEQFGWVKPIAANTQNEILAGHGMFLAAQKAGYTHTPVIFYSLDDVNSKGYVVADNRLSQLAEPDGIILQGLLDDLIQVPEFDIEATGFDLDRLDNMLEGSEEPMSFGNNQVSNYQNTPTTSAQNFNNESSFPEAPREFKEYNETIKTEHRCPKCGYEWSGKGY